MSSDREIWEIGNFVEVEAEKLVGAKRCPRDLQEAWRAKRRKVQKFVF